MKVSKPRPRKLPAPAPPPPRRRQVVVDGSNLATEGRSVPSLAQLDEAVRAWLAEYPDDEVIVVVDASFEYRIEDYEKAIFEAAEAAGELLSPPAGALGRGDGFLLRIAARTDAVVLSNDSFQEFHGQHPWLFDEGRLVGGKPVPGVGWIFTPRTPVRGTKSRIAVRTAKRAHKKLSIVKESTAEAIAEATVEAMAPRPPKKARRKGRDRDGGPPPEAVNEPLPFITFIAEHRLGTEVEGEVESFTSHGAFVQADGARCYVPVVGLGDPPPRSAKHVLKRGETRTFVVQALDAPRRGIELALPEVARPAGAPTIETVQAEIGASQEGGGVVTAKTTSARPRAAGMGVVEKAAAKKVAPKKEPAKRAAAKKVAAEKAPAKRAAAKKVAATSAVAKTATAKKAPAKKAAAKKAPAKKTVAKKAVAKKAVAKKAAVKKAPVKKAPAKRAAAKKAPTKKVVAKKAPARKVAAKTR